MKILIDHREMRSGVAEALGRLGADIETAALKVGDYVVSDRVAFERKTVDDLFATLFERCFRSFWTWRGRTGVRSWSSKVVIRSWFQAAGCILGRYRAFSLPLHLCASPLSTRLMRQILHRSLQ